MEETKDIQDRKTALEGEIKSAIEKFMDETGRGVRGVHVTASEGGGDYGFNFSVSVELEQAS